MTRRPTTLVASEQLKAVAMPWCASWSVVAMGLGCFYDTSTRHQIQENKETGGF